MTDEERQELRKWSAELMGYTEVTDVDPPYQGKVFKTPLGLVITEEYISAGFPEPWSPDLPTAPAWQILSVIDRMEKLGWYLTCHNDTTGQGFRVEFYNLPPEPERINRYFLIANTLPLAVLLAAKATGVLS